MSEEIREQISALLDSELAKDETRFTIEHLRNRAELRDTWDRYQLIGDALRGEAMGRATPSIADRVRDELASEPDIVLQHKPLLINSPWVRGLAGFALAASVATVAIMMAPSLLNAPGTSSQVAMTGQPLAYPMATTAQPVAHRVVAISTPPPRQVVSSGYHQNWYVENSGARWKNLAQPEVESKLNRYLSNHSEYATQSGVTRVMPYATFVGYDNTR